ncbi:DUF5691 domain-containing protein [Kitasatospora sp. A2-31]|uniref:DUF5691 domain-containing protein n=1 Tax=Kitasatospora sp. A2-31 TaxID=2916414 RepID=UPI001EEBA9A6|nr:DUF5691 domain-containing protein [Kitasatospora sp. A2-31]MCG6496499.1 DUF5691 domain-containing protein [Kitasatospora sp. A2-31]
MPDPWESLHTTALLGTDRRPLPAADPAVPATGAVDRGDPATALLELAALETVRRRAGGLPRAATVPIDPPAPADGRPELPAPAARRLSLLLGTRPGGSSAVLANVAELLPQWLGTARARGFRPPAALVPSLLDAARARSELRPDAVVLAGPLGRWLAARNPDWRFVLRTTGDIPTPGEVPTTGDVPTTGEVPTTGGASAPGTPAPRPADGDHHLWHEGLFAERVTHLTALRRTDPAAGLALLQSTWPTERAEDRLLFLDALQEGLSAADEPFLEAALGDRSKNVRATAAELLSTLPGSALARRMAERARAAVRLSDRGTHLLVTPPAECDAAMQRDGIAPKSPTGRGERAWWFGEVIAAAPLSAWSEATGLTPDQLLALRVGDSLDETDGSWSDDLREAWARAAVRQQDAGWARALLGPAPAPAPQQRRARAPRPSGAPAKLLAVLPAEERAAWTAAFIEVHGLGEAFQLLGACATPWTPPLSTAVVAALARAAASGAYPWSHSGVLGMTERALAPETAAAVEELAAQSTPATAWAETFARLAGTLRFREAMLAELAA